MLVEMSLIFENNHKLHTLWLSFVLLLRLLHAAPAVEEGEPCRIQSHSGICTSASKCVNLESTMKELGLSRRDIVSCGFTVYEELICCPAYISTTTPISIIATTLKPLMIGNTELDQNSEYYDFSKLKIGQGAGNSLKNELPAADISENHRSEQGKKLKTILMENGVNKLNNVEPSQPHAASGFRFPGRTASRTTKPSAQIDPFKAFEFRPQPVDVNRRTEDPYESNKNWFQYLNISQTRQSRNFSTKAKEFNSEETLEPHRGQIFDINFNRTLEIHTTLPSQAGAMHQATENEMKLVGDNIIKRRIDKIFDKCLFDVQHSNINSNIGKSLATQTANSEQNLEINKSNEAVVDAEDIYKQRLDEIFDKHFAATTSSTNSNIGQMFQPQARGMGQATDNNHMNIDKIELASANVIKQRIDQIFDKNFKTGTVQTSATNSNTDNSFGLQAANVVKTDVNNSAKIVFAEKDILKKRSDEIFDKPFPATTSSTNFNVDKTKHASESIIKQRIDNLFDKNFGTVQTLSTTSNIVKPFASQATNIDRTEVNNSDENIFSEENLFENHSDEIFDKNFSAISSSTDSNIEKSSQSQTSGMDQATNNNNMNIDKIELASANVIKQRIDKIFDKNFKTGTVQTSSTNSNNDNQLQVPATSMGQAAVNPIQVSQELRDIPSPPARINADALKERIEKIFAKTPAQFRIQSEKIGIEYVVPSDERQREVFL